MYREPLVYSRERVFCSGMEIKLLNPIGAGDEGIVYRTNTPFLCKIYRRDSVDYIKYSKIKIMEKEKIECEGICWPIEMAYDINGKFVGYLMEQAEGVRLKDGLLNVDNFIKLYPEWTIKNLVMVTILILEKIEYLHKNNIIIGDVNTENILVKAYNEVFFVDTDSYQVNNIPCPVGTQIFTPPEIKEVEFRRVIRTFGNEYFSIATLIFMILTLGSTPYGGENSMQVMRNIKNKYYYIDRNKFPLWDLLPLFIKKAFFNTFHLYGSNNSEFTRYSTKNWINILEKYLKGLENEKYENKLILPYLF